MSDLIGFAREVLTDAEGQYDLGYFLWVLGTFVFLGLAIVNWRHFDATAFGTGLSLCLGAGGAMTWLRAKSGVTQ